MIQYYTNVHDTTLLPKFRSAHLIIRHDIDGAEEEQLWAKNLLEVLKQRPSEQRLEPMLSSPQVEHSTRLATASNQLFQPTNLPIIN